MNHISQQEYAETVISQRLLICYTTTHAACQMNTFGMAANNLTGHA